MDDVTCIAPLCTSTKIVSGGRCRKHESRWRRLGHLGDDSPRTCPGCLTAFSSTRSDQTYCTRSCGLRTRRRIYGGLTAVIPVTRPCGWCETDFTHVDGRRLYCSEPCVRIASLLAGEIGNKFGLTLQAYRQMWLDQDGVCAICHEPESTPGREMLSVDHCHETGFVRGLLCNGCNRGLGFLGDTLERVTSAAEYLARAVAASRKDAA